MSDEDQAFVNDLAAQQSANLKEKDRLRGLLLRKSPFDNPVAIETELVTLDEEGLRLNKLLEIAKQEGITPKLLSINEKIRHAAKFNNQDLAKRIFRKQKNRKSEE